MKDMTETQARAEAIRRWGPSGRIIFRPSRSNGSPFRGRFVRYCCIVGNGVGGPFESVEGQGNTWREAFADARAR